ncbi:hypothetical protein [Deinococcus sp. QL22]|uniref:hypothetical protein n=1 Tax=Deinococcus sp. QL22 TaxID=2939437 RepID=UPI00201766F5|nr:hypothetical protein [Deinococcus sp. QL22]UQN10689.1 hypothetical protein M1R55_30405 [Deinococcus sp. QL22]
MITLTFQRRQGNSALFLGPQGQYYLAEVRALEPEKVAVLMGADFGAAVLMPHPQTWWFQVDPRMMTRSRPHETLALYPRPETAIANLFLRLEQHSQVQYSGLLSDLTPSRG